MFHVLRHEHVCDSGGLVGMGTSARERDGVPDESTSVVPNCGTKLDFGR